jgi:hypothetical protein
VTSSVQSPADVINLSLVMLGHPGRVGNLYDGSMPAKKALDIYAETRDEVLRVKDWAFALRQVAGVTTSPLTTVSGWAYSWNYPSDCLRVRSVAPLTIAAADYDPQPVLWTIFNDQTQSPPTKVILSQITPVKINYVGQITDMTTWEPLFVNALVQALCAKLGPSLRNEIAPQINVEAAISEATSADELQSPNDEMPLMLTQERRK